MCGCTSFATNALNLSAFSHGEDRSSLGGERESRDPTEPALIVFRDAFVLELSDEVLEPAAYDQPPAT
jgi:hypothetical protein